MPQVFWEALCVVNHFLRLAEAESRLALFTLPHSSTVIIKKLIGLRLKPVVLCLMVAAEKRVRLY